tara:strand:- start:716 stop:1018 length:303 start_codon:yes stop_codon:yes gene_type:complete
MSEKKYLLATGKINKENMGLLQEYSANTSKLMEAAGGKLISVFFTEEVLFGDNIPETLAVIEFPDAESIRNVINSGDYKKGIPLREKCFTELNYFIGNKK